MSKNKNRKQAAQDKQAYTKGLETKLATAITERDNAVRTVAKLEQVLHYLADKLGPDHVWLIEAQGILEDDT